MEANVKETKKRVKIHDREITIERGNRIGKF
jgi:hypothetical protein